MSGGSKNEREEFLLKIYDELGEQSQQKVLGKPTFKLLRTGQYSCMEKNRRFSRNFE